MDAQMQTLLDKLSAPFPPEAHEIDDSRGFTLVGIKGAYIVERLNEVFGPCGVGWTFKTTNADVDDKWIVVDLELAYRLNGNWSEPISVIGSSNIVKGRIGDAKKGAIQDGIKKAASYLGIGQEAYKGLLKADSRKSPRKPSPQRLPAKKAEKAKLPEVSGEAADAVANVPHWISDGATRKSFWQWTRDTLGLSNTEVHEALGVESVKDYAGTKADAHVAIMDYITRQVAAAARDVPEP